MALLDFNAFGGMEVTKHKSLRDFRTAEYAKNTRLWDGSLRAYRKPRYVGDCKCSNFILTPNGRLDCVKDCATRALSPCGSKCLYDVVDGRLHRDGSPVGLARPQETPVLKTLSNAGAETDAVMFRVVCVNDYGDASPPSAMTQMIQASYGQMIQIDWAGCTPYRVEALLVNSGSGGQKTLGSEKSEWVSVGEFEATSAQFPFASDTWDLIADGYDSEEFCDPPEIDCFVVMDSGHFVMWKGPIVYVSERHDPSRIFRYNIKTLHANVLEAVTARGAVYFSTDNGIYLMRVEEQQNATTIGITQTYENHIPEKNTLAILNSGAMYATKFGLAVVDEAGRQPQIATSQLIQEDYFRRDWLPKKGVVQRGIYYGTTDYDSWHIDFPGTSGAASEFGKAVRLDSLGGYQFASKDGLLYYSDPSGVWAFDDGAGYLAAEWLSSTVTLPAFIAFSRYKVLGSDLDGVVMTILADGKEVFKKTLGKENEVCSLPLCVRGIDYQIRLELPESDREIVVNRVQLSTSVNELSRV